MCCVQGVRTNIGSPVLTPERRIIAAQCSLYQTKLYHNDQHRTKLYHNHQPNNQTLLYQPNLVPCSPFLPSIIPQPPKWLWFTRTFLPHTKEIRRRNTHLKIHSKAFSQKSDPLQYAAVQYDLLFIYEQTNSNSGSGVSVFMAAETITLDFMLIFSKTMYAQFKLFFGLSRLGVHCVLFKFFSSASSNPNNVFSSLSPLFGLLH